MSRWIDTSITNTPDANDKIVGQYVFIKRSMADEHLGSSDSSTLGNETTIFEYLGIDENFEKIVRKGRILPTDIEDDIKDATSGKGAIYADIVRAYSDEDLKYNMLQAFRLVAQKGFPVILMKDLDFSAIPNPIGPNTVFMVTQDYLRLDEESEQIRLKQTLSGGIDKRLRGHLILIGVTDKTYNKVFGRKEPTVSKVISTTLQKREFNLLVSSGLLLVGISPILTVLMLVLPIDTAIYGSEPALGLLMVLLSIAGVILLVLGCFLLGSTKTPVIYVSLLVFAILNLVILVLSNAGDKALGGLTGANPPYIISPNTAAIFNSTVQIIIALVLFFVLYGFATNSEKWIAMEAVVATALGLIFTAVAPVQISSHVLIPVTSPGSSATAYPLYAFFNSSGIIYHPFFGLSAGLSIVYTPSYFYYVAALTMAIAANLLFSFVYLVVAVRGLRSSI